jgi:hypothetical protein
MWAAWRQGVRLVSYSHTLRNGQGARDLEAMYQYLINNSDLHLLLLYITPEYEYRVMTENRSAMHTAKVQHWEPERYD